MPHGGVAEVTAKTRMMIGSRLGISGQRSAVKVSYPLGRTGVDGFAVGQSSGYAPKARRGMKEKGRLRTV